ncbi:MAG: antibiotic biosynthesis monooxygenase [Candidatus Dormibacteraeota bacterium]|nr:antibiotic biosynthesis monooxygenase [Candidatus Dormibacteraeota bacterium]
MAESAHVIAALESVPERSDALVGLARQVAGELRKSPGVQYVRLLQRVDQPDRLEVVSGWESLDAYERAGQQPGVTAMLREIDHLLASPIHERVHEELALSPV